MTIEGVVAGVTGGDGSTLQESTLQKIGKATAIIEQLEAEAKAAKETDTARYDELRKEQDAQAAVLSTLKAKHEADEQAKADAEREANLSALVSWSKQMREPSKARQIGSGSPFLGDNGQSYEPGDFLFGVHEARSPDTERQAQGKALLRTVGERLSRMGDGKAAHYQEAWGKATLGTTDATGGWVIPNAVVDEFITPATHRNIYRELMTVVPGVTGAAIDIPYRSAARARAVIAAFGATKENVDLVYNGYTATMYTLARIYDIGNQFLRQSRGAAERDVLSELAAAFALGESYYVREGSGSSEPFGYTSALTNGPATFRSTASTVSDSTVAGSIAANIAIAAGDLAGRGVEPTAAVLAAAAYWQMLRQGSDSAGFWFATQERSPASIRPGTLISPFGIPVYADAAASNQGTAAVLDNLVVADWRQFKIYFGESYRVDSSDEAGTRWDANVTGFRGEEEMGFDARPAVYAGYAQMITDVLP